MFQYPKLHFTAFLRAEYRGRKILLQSKNYAVFFVFELISSLDCALYLLLDDFFDFYQCNDLCISLVFFADFAAIV